MLKKSKKPLPKSSGFILLAVQIRTGGTCHLDAPMITLALAELHV